MRKLGLIALVLVVGFAFSGCASVVSTKNINGQKLTTDGSQTLGHVNGSNWGIYLLPVIPLLTGDTEQPGSSIALVNDSVNVDSVVGMVTKKASTLGATKTIDLTSHTSSWWLIPTPFWYKSCDVSGNALK